MEYLYKLFYQLDHSDFIEKYEQRISMDSVVRFNLYIKPIKQHNVFELFYIPTNQIIEQVASIYSNASRLNFLFGELPPVAKDQYITECLVQELFHTNDLEGVKSSRDEIARSVRNIQLSKRNNHRFQSMIKSYKNLINNHLSLPQYPKDIRKIYDEITEGEIASEELPDGDIFRRDTTHVLAGSGSGKEIHRGIYPESKIINEIENMLKLLNGQNGIPEIIRVAVGHYFFGYIHPFYDGNGRTSRFISSLYLANTLGKIPALSLSRGCNKIKGKYLQAFDKTNRLMNRGEMNFFVDTFLEIISETLSEMVIELKEKNELLKIAAKKIEMDEKLESKNHSLFMFILAQNYFFQYSEGVSVRELRKEMGLSSTTIRKVASELIEKSFVQQKGVRPALYVIDPEYFETE